MHAHPRNPFVNSLIEKNSLLYLVLSFFIVCKMLAKFHNFYYFTFFQALKKIRQKTAFRQVPKFVKIV
ncbi:MAG: hypothetical protein AMK69_08005 [Nitrospira bacterium SG8_3]|nr:MAG: hypothetical protein AMK69_08005 [Nitrospira bacterium SG8_3]